MKKESVYMGTMLTAWMQHKNIKYVTFSVTDDCNLMCEYCYFTHKNNTHLFNVIPYFTQKLKESLDNRLDKRKIQRKAKLFREFILLIIFTLINILLNIYIIAYIVIKKFTIGDYTYYNSIINNLKNNADKFVTTLNEFQISLKKVKNYTEFLYNDDNEYKFGTQAMPEEIQTITFSHVYFRYPNSSEFVLNDLSFEVRKNEKIALAGLNGAGKSTIINLLLRFYEPTDGQILINGFDIQIFDLNKYWNCFSCMFQRSNLYNITLKENLLLGNIDKVKSVKEKALCSFLSSIGMALEPNHLNQNISKQFDKEGMIFSPGQELLKGDYE